MREEEDRLLWLACRGGDVLAALQFSLPQKDNLRLADGELVVDPSCADQAGELFDALWSQARSELVRRGRDLVWFWHVTTLGVEETLTPRTGSGTVAADEVSAWLQGRGFALEQVEVLARCCGPG